MNADAPNLNSLWGRLFIEELVRIGLGYFCLPPGSRCAPLTTAAAAHPGATCIHHFDERGAAFHALGYARATGRPAVLITTSGTAVANTWPAVVEASMDRVPMILVTADRPPELHDTGANQTIDQVKLFGPYVRWQIDLPCPDTQINPEVILTGVDQAVYRAQRSPQGPVHINCMYREPLAPVSSGEDYTNYLSGLESWLGGTKPFTEYMLPGASPMDQPVQQLTSTLNKIERGLVVVGSLGDPEQSRSVRKLIQKLSWPTLPDITSGLRLGNHQSPMIPHFDAALASPRFADENQPQAVLHLGGRLISKRLLDYLERCRPCPYILVNDHPLRHDPFHGVTLRIEAEVSRFCESLLPHLKTKPKKESPWLSRWREGSDRVTRTLEAFTMENGGLSEPLVAWLVSQLIRPDDGLFLAASMPVRDADTYGAVNGSQVQVACNRGTNGIDGTLATATGFAQGLKRPVTLLIGDIALLHDLNSLYLLRSIEVPVIVVVLNNNGGGIFSFLPIAQFPDHFERYFGTPHNLTFEGAAGMFGLAYAHPLTKEAFIDSYRGAHQSGQSTVIEITTERKENYDLHVRLLETITSNLNRT